MTITRIVGIVNMTRDSFSDGGRFLAPEAAVAHARQLVADGADVVDLGAESTHPDSEDVGPEVEIDRLTPVIRQLKGDGLPLSVDTYKPAVIRHVLELGVDDINDITALRDPESVAAVRDSQVRLILMHSQALGARAERGVADPATLVDEIVGFFEQRIAALTSMGIARARLILDPGMGMFLGSNPEASLAVLRDLERLRRFDLPLLISTSRKSFIGAVLGDAEAPRPVDRRGAGTLATELWAVTHGATYVRTHDVRALRDMLTMWAALVRRSETGSREVP
jgi:dihydropteroate synthase type 2